MKPSRFHSLEDFLASKMLTVDAEANDGWGAPFPVKGREIDATILFADITGFSARTADLDPVATLAFVNHFFTWITAEALDGRPGIIDKYIGDEVMIVFSREFGSEDPFTDAVQAARWMGQNDAFAFAPHVGIASGEVIVGYVGTPRRYGCSVFGAPVALAARCASVVPPTEEIYSSSVAFPSADWGDREFDDVFRRAELRDPDGSIYKRPQNWQLLESHSTELKNLGSVDVRHAVNKALWVPTQSAEERARETAMQIAKAGRRWQRPT